MMEWTRKERGSHFCLMPEGTWIARKSNEQWRLFYQPLGSKLEQHGVFPRLRTAKRYTAQRKAK